MVSGCHETWIDSDFTWWNFILVRQNSVSTNDIQFKKYCTLKSFNICKFIQVVPYELKDMIFLLQARVHYSQKFFSVWILSHFTHMQNFTNVVNLFWKIGKYSIFYCNIMGYPFRVWGSKTMPFDIYQS